MALYGSIILALLLIDISNIAIDRSQIRVVLAQMLPPDGKRLLIVFESFLGVALALIDITNIVEAGRDGGVILAKHLDF